MFRDIDAMRERIPVWSSAVGDVLPLDEDAAKQLEAACERSTRIARQARALYERGNLPSLTIPALRDEMVRQGLDVDRFIEQDKLVFDDEDIPTLLKLVDEKLYLSWHSNIGWDVGTRAPRES